MGNFFTNYKTHLAFSFSLIPFIVLAYFSQPFMDDFGFATQTRESNFMELLKLTYQGQNGRYIANIFMYATPLSFNSFFGYKLTPIILILLTLTSFHYLIKQLINTDGRTRSILTLATTSTYITGLPIISEGLYWYTGSSIYYLGSLSSIMACAQLLKTLKTKPKAHNYFVLGIMLFISCGFNETQTAINFLITLIVCISHMQRKTPHAKYLLFLLAIATLSAMVMYGAPGNANRASLYTGKVNDLLHSTKYTIAQLIRFSADWLFSIPLLATSVLFVHKHDWLCDKSNLINHGFYLNKWISLLILFVPIVIGVFPAYWFTGILGQHRTLNVAYLSFLMAWIVNLSVWINHPRINAVKNQIKAMKAPYLVALILLGCVATDNGYHAITNLLSGDAKEFDSQMNMRHELLTKTPNKPGIQVELEPITAKPKSLFINDITTDPSNWINRGYNDYYNLNQVRIKVKPQIITQNAPPT